MIRIGKMIRIDGSYGEGGGQILRSALSLSLITEKPFKIENIRANRKKPGLMRQHLTCVNAASEIGSADCEGAFIGSTELSFEPAEIKYGKFEFKVGTAGSATLVLQSVLPALLMADGVSEITLEGGTHNPMAPPYDFLEKAFVPVLRKMGAKIETEILDYGFFPAGGGKFRVKVAPFKKINPLNKKINPLNIDKRGEIIRAKATAVISNLPGKISERELAIIGKKLSLIKENDLISEIKDSKGPGNILFVEIESENVTEVFTGFGIRGVRAEQVAGSIVKRVKDYLKVGVPVYEYLADQLLIPFALAKGGSFITSKPTAHTLTNIDIIEKFLDVKIECKEIEKKIFRIEVKEI